MRIDLHPRVSSDIAKIMASYEKVASEELADEFYRELREFIEKTATTPELFPIRERNLRRANLARFPYHILFRVNGESVRILVVRHHRRNPRFAMSRR